MSEQSETGPDVVGYTQDLPSDADELVGAEDLDLSAFPSPGLDVRGSGKRPKAPAAAFDDEDLFEWMERFDYQPGVSFVRVVRLHPSKWRNIAIKGFTEDLDEPVDISYLAERWGGGSYRLLAKQLTPSGDRTKTVAQFTTTVAGPPRAYRDQNGDPLVFPPEEPARGRWEEEDDEFRGGGGRSQSAYDLLMAERMANRGDAMNTETLEVVRRAQQDANEHYSKAVEQQQSIATSTIDAQREELSLMRERQRETDERRQEPIRQATSMIEARANAEMGMMRSQLDSMRGEHSAQMTALQNQHQMQLGSIERQHAAVVDALQRELQRTRDDGKSRVDQTQAILAAQYQGQISALEQRLVASETAATQQVTLVRGDAQHRETTLQTLMSQGFEHRIAVMAQERDRLIEEKRATGAELAQLRALAGERKDPLTSLVEMQSLIGAVRELSGDGPPEPPPDDFIGKVAHYAPGIAKNFLGPVMERVDRAAGIAEHSLTLQQQAIAAPPPGYDPRMGVPPQPQLVQPAPQFVPVEAAQVPIEDDSPLIQIVEFLDTQLAQQSGPGETATTLRTAVQAGMVPAEAFHTFVSRDSNVITGEVMDAAAARGAPNLNSPVGATFIQQVLSVLKGGS